jgi:hypothetical protein
MKNVHLIATNKPSRLYLNSENKICITDIEMKSGNNQHIYITDNSEIKEGDWIYGLFNGGVILKSEFNIPKNTQYYKEYGLKIILTTDLDLIADGIQAIDDEFLEWFVKNPSCEEVEVEKWTDYKLENDKEIPFFSYKIIIPKEETEHLLSTETNKKRLLEDVSKQETLEEVAERVLFLGL